MQLLSGDFLSNYGKDVINIHHGLLPSFKGGNPSKQVTFCVSFPIFLHHHIVSSSMPNRLPYISQAFDAGVKLIGATSHFVTEELDSGPIIEQMVISSINHCI